MICIVMIDFIRMEVATRGNKVGEWKVVLLSIFLALPIMIGFVFFVRLQSYV